MYQPKTVVTSADEIREILGSVSYGQTHKVIDHIDEHCRKWIERSPFIVVSTTDRSGRVDVSPKGDPAGFVKIIDPKTLAVPDRSGNNRGDTFMNILENPHIGLMFVIPRRREVVRVSGQAQIVRDHDLLASMAIRDRKPDLAILVRVEKAFFHCGKSMIRSGMWQPDAWGSIDGLPSYADALMAHAKPSFTKEEMQARIETSERERLY